MAWNNPLIWWSEPSCSMGPLWPLWPLGPRFSTRSGDGSRSKLPSPKHSTRQKTMRLGETMQIAKCPAEAEFYMSLVVTFKGACPSSHARIEVKYLTTLEKFIEPLYTGTPSTIIEPWTWFFEAQCRTEPCRSNQSFLFNQELATVRISILFIWIILKFVLKQECSRSSCVSCGQVRCRTATIIQAAWIILWSPTRSQSC